MFLLEVAKAFQIARVPYALVGGYAVALHGAVRGTVDVDIILKLSKRDYVQAEATLVKLGLTSRLPVQAEEVFDFRIEYIKNRNLIAWSFSDPKRPQNQLDIIITQNLDDFQVDTLRLHGINVKILSKKSLIQMKRKSGRPQDLEDIKALESLLNER